MLPGIDTSIEAAGNSGGGGGQGAFSVAIFPAEVSRTASATGPAVLITNTVTAYPEGGTAPYSFQWTMRSGFGVVSAEAPDDAATAFSAFLNPGEMAEATMRVTVTDATQAMAFADILVALSLINRNNGVEL